MENLHFEVVIIGAGPAGLSAALHLAGSGLSVAIADREVFPREKVCGGGISELAIDALKRVPGDVFNDFVVAFEKNKINGVKFFSPLGYCIEIPQFIEPCKDLVSGYACERAEFDNFLLNQVKKTGTIRVFEGSVLEQIKNQEAGYQLVFNNLTLTCNLLIGADGIHSVVSNQLLKNKKIERLKGLGISVAYSGIKDLHPDNYLEFYFLRKILPGYFWIFPYGDGKANVGLYLPEKLLRKKKINLKKEFANIITRYPTVSNRFEEAVPLGQPKAGGLPWGKLLRTVSGERFMLVGDAAGLVEPFTGEGIGTALVSGEAAANQARKCFESNNFSSLFISRYDNMIYKQVGGNYLAGYRLMLLLRYSRLINFLFKRAIASDRMKDMDIHKLRKMGIQKKLTNPLFFLKLILRKHLKIM